MSDINRTRTIKACPDCDSSEINRRDSGRFGADERWRCVRCGHTFAAPVERSPKQPGGNYSAAGQALLDADPDDLDLVTDGGRDTCASATERSDHYLYAVTVACPCCDEVTQFVEVTDAPAALDMDVLLDGKSHCPECGVHLSSVDEGWDLCAEHEIETVSPTQEADRDV